MTRRHLYALLAAFALCFAMAVAWIATGKPLSWAKGIVLPNACTHVAKGYICQVELVPDGTRKAAQSDAAIAGRAWVNVRVWHNLISGTVTHTVVDDTPGAAIRKARN